jgi:uridylate kinase
MALIIQKFGGTSVGSTERIENVAEKVIACRNRGHQVVVVVSAMSGETDRLVELAKAITTRPSPREMDVLLATGEQVTIALLSMALEKRGYSARSYTGFQVHILTDSAHNKARIREIEGKRIRADLEAGRVVVVAGFQGIDEEGNITTLGRGGSDTTAVALAAALKGSECQIFTDVDGVYTSDPRVVPTARLLDRITFEEMLEMARPTAKHANVGFVEGAPTPVGSHPAGASAFGVHDLVGDGWEWTSTPFLAHEGFTSWIRSYSGYSRDFFDGQHNVLLGGSWATPTKLVRRSFRNWFRTTYPYPFTKFRLVRDD